MKSGTRNVWKTLASFFMVLFTMPLGHALMIVMGKFMSPISLQYSAFAMGGVGLVIVIIGILSQGDTKQTLLGFFGGLLFWTGWVKFLFMHYAHRYGVQSEIITGEVVTKPEYLVLPAIFGFWAIVMVLYLCSIKTGYQFINWWKKLFFKDKRNVIIARPMTSYIAIVTFMELMYVLLWSCYLLLMFCYDNRFLGDHHPVTFIIGIGCFIASGFMFKKQLKISSWGANIRFSIATVIIFWIPVEILGRIGFFSEIWVEPMKYVTEILIILILFVLMSVYLWYITLKRKHKQKTVILKINDLKP